MKRLIIITCVFLTLFALNSHVQDEIFFTQYVDPEVILIFDTSGSMTWDLNGCGTWGDGAHGVRGGRDTDGDGLVNDSRLYITKEALHQVVAEFGFYWGLFKFLQGQSNNYEGAISQYFDADTTCDNDVENDYFPVSDICYTSWGYQVDYDYIGGSCDYRCDYYDSGGNYHDFYGNEVPINYYGTTSSYAVDALEEVVTPSEGSPSHISLIQSYINNDETDGTYKEFSAIGGTPIAPALRGARFFFKDEIPSDNARWCRRYFVILITDGEPTYGIEPSTYDQGENAGWSGYDGSSPYWMRQQCWAEAESLRNTYLPPQGGDTAQTVDIQTFVVGIGIASETLDSIARFGGTDNPNSPHFYFPAHSPEDVIEAFRTISAIITQKASSFSSGEVTSVEEEFLSTEYEARMYLASFFPLANAFWDGHLTAVKLSATTGGISLDSIPDSLIIWDAGDSLQKIDPASRNIRGVKNNSLLQFNSSNFDTSDLKVGNSAAVDTIVSLVKSAEYTMDTTGYLGDIFHSAPLRIHIPNAFYQDDGFGLFRAYMETTRTSVIYAGANDGMIHAFDDSTGYEIAGIIPKNFIPEIKTLRDSHRYYVDADPMAADVWFPSSPLDSFKNWDEWKTVLFAPQGEGGRGITVLDVTDPDSIKYLLGFHKDTMALSTSSPVIYKVQRTVSSDTVDRFFAFFGGGEWPDSLYDKYDPLNSDSLKGNVIVAIDIYDAATNGLSYGSNFWFIPPRTADVDKMKYPFASAAKMVNKDPEYGTVYDFLYIPDLAGQMWKVDVRNPNVSSWEATCIFQPPIPTASNQAELWQPAFYAPLIEKDPTYGCYWLFYGTGDRSKVFTEDPENRFYAIMDTLTAGSYPLQESDLKDISPSGSFNPVSEFPSYNGWFIKYDDYGHDGEKTVTQATMLMDTISFGTFEPIPPQNDPCATGTGTARYYYFHFRTGGFQGGVPFIEKGAGVPQAPRYSFSLEGSGWEINQTSDSLWIEETTGYGTFKRILKWKEE